MINITQVGWNWLYTATDFYLYWDLNFHFLYNNNSNNNNNNNNLEKTKYNGRFAAHKNVFLYSGWHIYRYGKLIFTHDVKIRLLKISI